MQDVFDYIDSHVDVYLERLAFLCGFETLAKERKGVDQGALRVASLFEQIGVESQIITLGETCYVVTQLEGTGNGTLGFYNHFDTYPIGSLELWESPPFQLTSRDGFIFARGVCDNKGNIVARLSAIEAYRRVRGKLPLNIILLQDAEEEIGSPTLGLFVDRFSDLIRADGWIWEGGAKDANERLEIYLGAHGILYVTLTVTTAREDIHGSYAGSFPNAVARLVWLLNSIQDQTETILINDFYEDVEAASPEIRRLLTEIPLEFDTLRKKLGINELPEGYTTERVLERQYLEPYVSITGTQGGSLEGGVEIILPHEATAKVGFFLVPKQEPDTVFDQLKRHVHETGFYDVKIERVASLPPSGTRPSATLSRGLVRCAQEIYGTSPVVFPRMRGISPMGHFSEKFGVPVIGTGVGHVNSRIHQPNESIRVKDFIENIKLMAALIEHMGQSEEPWT